MTLFNNADYLFSSPVAVHYAIRKLSRKLGQPFNGQLFRRRLFDELSQRLRFSAIVETGANFGATTEYFAATCECPIYTCEIDPRRAAFVSFRLRACKHVIVTVGHSPDALRKTIVPKLVKLDGIAFFYLDAHWHQHLPLGEELSVIFSSGLAAVIMIDDFNVPGDDGYGYDDYGDMKAIEPAYLHRHIPGIQAAFYPTTPSAAESGARRGCAVLATNTEIEVALCEIALLRKRPLIVDDQRRGAVD